jgi:hypothetical protein
MNINQTTYNGIILIIFLFLNCVANTQSKLNSKKVDLGHKIDFRDVKERINMDVLKIKSASNENIALNSPSILEQNLIQLPFDSSPSYSNQIKKLKNFANEYEIQSMSTNFYLDAKKKSCDVKVADRMKILMNQPSDRLDYIIISKKTPLYGITPKILSGNVEIKNFEVYEDSSFKQRIYIDSEGRKLSFRDRWLISMEFSKPVGELEMELEYFLQRAILIDNIKEANYLKVSLINPHQFNIEGYNIVVNLLNFEKLNPEEINTPINGMVKVNGKEDIQIITNKKYEKHSEIEVFLSLPYELVSCDGNLVNIVFYGLIFTSATFVVLSLITIGFLYKE